MGRRLSRHGSKGHPSLSHGWIRKTSSGWKSGELIAVRYWCSLKSQIKKLAVNMPAYPRGKLTAGLEKGRVIRENQNFVERCQIAASPPQFNMEIGECGAVVRESVGDSAWQRCLCPPRWPARKAYRHY